MKLIICGKGGSGKSTITALLARHYASAGKRVVVVDTDVSNTGLHRILGTASPPDLTGYFTGKRSMREVMKNAREKGIPRGTPLLGTWTYDTIPEEYSAVNHGVKLVSIGKIHDATQFGKGRWTGLARQFLGGLQLAEDDRVLIDAEAGIEHFSRGLGEACDAILVVIDPSYESTRLATTVSKMAKSVEVPVYFVLNKTNPGTSPSLRNCITDASRIIGEFSEDRALLEAGLAGRPFPADYPAATAIVEKVEGINAA
jgi:CO dehydrogenase maturation factor